MWIEPATTGLWYPTPYTFSYILMARPYPRNVWAIYKEPHCQLLLLPGKDHVGVAPAKNALTHDSAQVSVPKKTHKIIKLWQVTYRWSSIMMSIM